MMVRPIRTEADYDQTLARLGSLMDAAAGTPEADELEVLATLVERYEDERFPIAAPSPVAAIRFRMEQDNLTPRDLEPFIGSRARVSEVLSGARPLSIDMIRALNQHLGIPASVLIQPDTEPARSTVQLSRPAASQLIAWGLLGAKESFEAFLERAFGSAPAVAMLRKTRTERTNAKSDPAAVQAWCAAALLLSKDVQVEGVFAPGKVDMDLVRALAKLSTREDGPVAARQFLASIGVALVVLPHLPGTHLDGAAMRRPDGTPLIALTLRRDRIDNFWFTLLHEFAHVARHLGDDNAVILDDLEISSSEAIEKEADEMAEVALIPAELWSNLKSGAYASLAEIQDLAAQAQVHPAIVAGRWQLKNRDFRKFSKLLGHGLVRGHFPEFQRG